MRKAEEPAMEYQDGPGPDRGPDERRGQEPADGDGMLALALDETDALAAAAHAGQVDKIGVPYVEHVRAVARGLAPVSDRLVRAGLLHDVVEDTEWSLEGLLAAGVPADVVALVDAVTKKPGVSYEDMIRRIAADEEAALLKIADNAHNARPDRLGALPPEQRERLETKYAAAREVLWPAVDRELLETVVRRVNPALLEPGPDGGTPRVPAASPGRPPAPTPAPAN